MKEIPKLVRCICWSIIIFKGFEGCPRIAKYPRRWPCTWHACSPACAAAAAAAKSLQSCPILCDPTRRQPTGLSVPGILQARTLEWVAISFSNAWKWKVKVKSLSRVWLLATPQDSSPPGSSVHGIFQAGVLEWDAIAFSPSLGSSP